MKKTLSVLALSLCSSAAMAAIINFDGSVSAPGTCPIEVVTPGGPSLPVVFLGNFNTFDFDAIGQETTKREFALRVPASCVTGTQNAYATFQAGLGADPANADLYALRDGLGYTTGLGLAINDLTKRLKPNTESMAYEVKDTGDTDMVFSARLVTTAAKVSEGQIDSNISFNVDIR
ncbi:fimbrial protein [Pseudomonas sp. 5FOS]|jgi:major type 1 subunit fimbrin (pilin)|uniref:fimbrial protein n=1 Tax=unclassified Pseudomonas TaxID=196821 RepID=UPI001A9F96C1|nr:MULTISPECIES: fimbrial protein [unclassified Pseudomonas]MCE5986480.1 fimbrial protein [Pseudomonas sp. LM20]